MSFENSRFLSAIVSTCFSSIFCKDFKKQYLKESFPFLVRASAEAGELSAVAKYLIEFKRIKSTGQSLAS